MNASTEKVPRRKRKSPPRRVPTVIEQPERKPFLFGWGADLSQREREGLKERIALFAGVGLAVALALILGWGWYQDNIAGPAAVQAQNNKPVAQVGTYTITLGYFKRFETLENTQFNNQLTQIQQEISAYQSQPNGAKKNAAQISQLESEQSLINQRLGSLASGSLQALIDNHAVLQRSSTAGVPNTPQLQKQALTQLEQQAGGRVHLLTSIKQSGLSESEIVQLQVANNLETKIQNKLASQVSRYQIKVRASHILVPASKKSLAEQLYQKALHGANFAALAKKYSTDPGSAKKGGDLGYFARGTMVAPFDQAAFSMKVGQIRLVKSQYGWHIIKLTGRKRMRLTSTEYQQAQQTAYTNWLAKQEAQIHVERFLSPQQLPNVATPSALNNTTQNSVPVPTAAPVATVAPVNPSTTGRSSQSTSSKKKP